MSPRRLLLLRHGKAETPDRHKADFDRTLTERGRAAARLIGAYLAGEDLVPDLVLCSPSERTRETLAGVVEAMGKEAPTQFLDALYDAPTDTYLNQIAEHGGSADTLLVVGHNPSTEAAVSRLCRNPDDRPTAFPTCALAVMACDLDDWLNLAPRSAKLISFVRPRDLEAG